MTRSSANGRLVRRRPSPNRAPPVPKCALERYGLIREQRNVIIVVIRLARSRSLALRLQMGTSLPPTSHVSRRASKCRVDQWSGLERSAIHSLAHRIAHSHCSAAAFYFRALRSLLRPIIEMGYDSRGRAAAAMSGDFSAGGPTELQPERRARGAMLALL